MVDEHGGEGGDALQSVLDLLCRVDVGCSLDGVGEPGEGAVCDESSCCKEETHSSQASLERRPIILRKEDVSQNPSSKHHNGRRQHCAMPRLTTITSHATTTHTHKDSQDSQRSARLPLNFESFIAIA